MKIRTSQLPIIDLGSPTVSPFEFISLITHGFFYPLNKTTHLHELIHRCQSFNMDGFAKSFTNCYMRVSPRSVI